ncbi:MAG: choice-of-anchor H family protein [Candidatus Thiodiazotropha sp. (ex Codakia rugifera)]|nr:choice-of-anchor H family protein [Candidatus Thiodiazotropha sp. (ex Codakia rugifera)]
MQRYSLTKWIPQSVACLLMLALSGTVLAAEEVLPLTQSVAGPVAAQEAVTRSEQLDQADVDEHKAFVIAGSRMQATAQRSVAAHATGHDFSIFDAQTVISRDDDDDGYYHRLKVTFDADVPGDEAWVYAKLYLSLEGGPWNHYFTTDNFPIAGETTEDDYEVVTRLLDGYPTGYYDVLIELYDADDELLVVNYGPYDDIDLSVLPMEDSFRDDYDDYGGGGAFGLGLVLLGLLGVVVRYPAWRKGRDTACV